MTDPSLNRVDRRLAAKTQLAGQIRHIEGVPVPGAWGRIFNDDPMVAAAMLDRLLHRSVVFNIDGESYRMRAHRARADKLRGKGAKRD